MICVDVGCARHGEEYSIERLIERFKPTQLYGFDPLIDPAEWECSMPIPGSTRYARLVFFRALAWTFDGQVGFKQDASRSRIDANGTQTPCMDLAALIEAIHDEEAVMVKFDAEGAEYELLEHLMAQGVDERLSMVWVEWHPQFRDETREWEATLKERLKCRVEDWHW